MEEGLFELIQADKRKQELAALEQCNGKTERFGLTLSGEAAARLIACRNESLKKYERIEFGNGILDKLIFTFCDSQYIEQDNYEETLVRLQDIFYEFKNRTNDKLTDDELLTFMSEQYEKICFGDLDYLETTCLERYAAAIRAGYDGYRASGGRGEYDSFSEEQRWDKELYREALKELCWR